MLLVSVHDHRQNHTYTTCGRDLFNGLTIQIGPPSKASRLYRKNSLSMTSDLDWSYKGYERSGEVTLSEVAGTGLPMHGLPMHVPKGQLLK